MKCLFHPVRQLLCLSTLLHFSSNVSSLTKECFVNYDIKPVTFSSLVKYQASSSSFNPKQQSYKGNIVDFDFDSIDRLVRNSFVSFDSNSIIKITLSHKRIKTIDAGAFNGLFCLHYLDLKRNDLSNLTDDVFEGLGNLRHLDLSNNLIEAVPSLLFRHLRDLRELNVSRNRIRSVNTLAFFNSTRLEVLDLSFNKIRNLLPTVFSSLQNLRELYLNNNYLGDIEPEKWIGLDNLEVLNLANNYLNKFDPSYNFSFTGLKKLNLSGNALTSLNAFNLRRSFVKLEEIDITENNWLCEDLEVINHHLADSGIGRMNHVRCNLSGEYKHSTTEESISSTSTPIAPTTVTSRDSFKDTSFQNEEELLTNKKLMETIQRNQTIFVWLLVVVIVYILIDVANKGGAFQYLYTKMTGRYYRRDSNEDEHLLLSNNY